METVMVTGATGYVAGWLVKRLLDAGFTVHAPVRDPENAAKTAHLRKLAEQATGEIRFFDADLLRDGSYDAAMEGCAVVFHTASPFRRRVRDVERDLLQPALGGTRNVLGSVNRTPSVRRVVLTSSCAAIFGDNADLAATPRGVFDETCWNSTSTPRHSPYSYSKTVAERAAWEIADAQERWTMVTINPMVVIGPSLNPRPTSDSFTILRGFADGAMKRGAPNIGIGVVDVRDVAEAHFRAAFRPEAHGRYLVCGQCTNFMQIADALREPFGSRYPLPRKALPKWVAWLFAPLVDPSVTRRFIARNANLPWLCDNSKSVRELGLEYRPMAPALREMFAQMVAAGD